MDKTFLEIPTELLQAANLTAEEARRELAIHLYQIHRLNGTQAGELAGDPRVIESLSWSRNTTGHFDLDNFLSWASHDLKTPLNTIIGFSTVLLKGLGGPINKTQETDISTVYRAGQRMLALIGYLVEIARLNNRQTKPARGECNILELVAETADRWKKENPSKPLAIQTNIADAVFKLDKGLMRQIFSHLLTFASLRVTEGTVSLSASDSDDTLKIRAQSHGTKSPNKFEMDSTMLHFILTSLVNLHGGQMDDPRETEDGLLLSFSVPR